MFYEKHRIIDTENGSKEFFVLFLRRAPFGISEPNQEDAVMLIAFVTRTRHEHHIGPSERSFLYQRLILLPYTDMTNGVDFDEQTTVLIDSPAFHEVLSDETKQIAYPA